MKTKIISELFSVATIGSLCGLLFNGSHLKWHKLGREAFLAHESQYFDKTYLNPVPAVHVALAWLLIALFFYAIYKCIAVVTSKILCAITSKKITQQA